MKKVYIAGPMTGYDHYNVSAFEAAAFLWRAAGDEPTTPFECNSVVWRRHHGRDFNPYEDTCDWGDPILRDMLAEDIRVLTESDVVAFLNGWEKSKGARLEYAMAQNLGIPCVNAITREPVTLPESILAEADRIVAADRQSDYGHPIEDFTRTGRMWGAILGVPWDVPPEKVAMCMVAIKLSRECNKPKRDNRVDAAGYVKTLELVRERQAQ